MSTSVTFEINQSSVKMELWSDNKTAEVALVQSQYKKRGLATQALKAACDYADFYDLELVLTVSPFGTPGHQLEEADLKAWYMTFGFLNEGDGVMARPRKSANDARIDTVFERAFQNGTPS